MNAQDVAQQLPDVAARMHAIAHLEDNWIQVEQGDDLAGRRLPFEEDDPKHPGQKIVVKRLVSRPGMVPFRHLLLIDRGSALERAAAAGAPIHPDDPDDQDDLCLVPNLAAYLSYKYKLVSNDTRAAIVYTVDVVPPGMSVSGTQRHLSIQITVPGQVTQGELANVQDQLLAGLDGIVGVFLPAARLGVEVVAGARAGEPWEVVDPSKPIEIRAKTWKTPVVFDFMMSHELLVNREKPKKKVQLYGPNGQPV